MDFQSLFRALVASLAFAAVGILVFAVAFGLIKWITPFSIRKEIEEDHNTALAIVIGAVIIGIALIIAAAVHG
jgi:putative membrane protein